MTDILLAEDDNDIREWVAVALERDSWRVRTVCDGAAAVAAYAEKRPDLMILDVMMPKMSGWDVVSEIRKRDKAVPILILTAKAAESDKVTGLGLGADDYLTKPFGLAELRARVAALLRRAGISAATRPADEDFAFGALRVSVPRSVLVSSSGEEVVLTQLELGVLRFLAAHPGEVVTREAILNGLWGVSYTGTTRTLDTRVASLRKKLGADAVHLETIYGSGYRYRP